MHADSYKKRVFLPTAAALQRRFYCYRSLEIREIEYCYGYQSFLCRGALLDVPDYPQGRLSNRYTYDRDI